jgi:hypothetical protein
MAVEFVVATPIDMEANTGYLRGKHFAYTTDACLDQIG